MCNFKFIKLIKFLKEESEEKNQPQKDSLPVKEEPKSFIELLIKETFTTENDRSKFVENITRLLTSIKTEVHKDLKFLNELDEFFNKENLQLTKNMFDNSRKLFNFFNGIIRLFFLLNRLEALILFIKKNLNDNKNNLNKNIEKDLKILDEIRNERKEINRIFVSLQKVKILDFSRLIEIDNLENSNIKELFEFDDKDIHKRRCQLCLHDIDVDGKTKLFSGEFHIICINYWINVIDNNSPFN